MSSTTANLTDPRLQDRIAERYRQLRSRVDRARPIYEQHKRGELVALNAEQRKLVNEYPQWLEDLEELRHGRMPAPRTTPASSAAAAAGPASTIPGLGPLVSKTKKRGKKGGGGGGGGNIVPAVVVDAGVNTDAHHGGTQHAEDAVDEAETEPAEATEEAQRQEASVERGEDESDEEVAQEDDVDAGDITSEEDLLAILQVMQSRDVQEELIHAYVDRYMAHQSVTRREFAEAEKRLASAETLKKKIISAAIKKPSNAQLSVIEQLPSLRKQVSAGRKKVKKEDQQMRGDLLKKLDEMGGDEANGEEEADVPEEALAASSEKVAEGDPDDAAPPVTPEEDNPWAAAPAEATAVPSRCAEDKGPDSEEEAAPPTSASEDREEAKVDQSPVEHAALEPAEDERLKRREEEEERVPTPPPPATVTFTPGSDWSKLCYSKADADAYTLEAFVELAGPVCKKEVEAAAAAASFSASPSPRSQEEGEETAVNEALPSNASASLYVVDNSAHYVRQHICIGPTNADAAPAATREGGDIAESLKTEAAATGVPESWLGRIQQELEHLQHSPIPRVTVYKAYHQHRSGGVENKDEPRKWLGARPAEGVQWHVDVAPADGPLAGQQVHLVMTFPPAYPFVPPSVHCPVSMPHKGFMVSQTGQSNTLFLTYRQHDHLLRAKRSGKAGKRDTTTSAAAAITTGGWLPDMGARAAVQELRDFFSAANFAPTAEALGTEAFEREMGKVRVALGLSRARCATCDSDRGGAITCVNGPFLVPAGAAAESKSEEEEEEGAKDASDGQAAAQSRKKTRSAQYGAHAVSVKEGSLQGPFLGCWANLLYTERKPQRGEPNHAGYLHLAVAGGSEDGQQPTVEIYEAPSSFVVSDGGAQSKRGGGSGGASLAAWAGTLLTTHSASDAKERPVWSLPADALANGNASCVVQFVRDGDAEGAEAQATSSTVLAKLPTSSTDESVFAMVVRVPGKGQGLSLTFGTSPQAAVSNSPATATTTTETETASDSAEFFALWPDAKNLVDGAKTNETDSQKKGLFVGVPFGFAGITNAEDYLASIGGSGAVREEEDPVVAAARQEGYYIPRRVTFHLRDGKVPVVDSAEDFFHYKTLIANTRRGRARPKAAVAEPEENFLAVAPEEVVRRHVLGDKGPAGGGASKLPTTVGKKTTGRQLSSAHAVATLSDFFLGLRTLFLPCSPCSETDLAKFKDTCMLLYRNPQASTKYKAPFRPLCALHLLSLVLGHALDVSQDSDEEEGRTNGQVAQAVVRQVLALSHQLAEADKDFMALCKSLAETKSADKDGDNISNPPFLFQTTPFTPLYVFEKPNIDGKAAREEATPSEVRARALKDLGYAMGAASEVPVAAYEAETETLGRLVATWASGLSPLFDAAFAAGSASAGKKAQRWVKACNAAVSSK